MLMGQSFILIYYFSPFSPWRIVDDCGGAFSMGCIGGGVVHAILGARNAPSVSDTGSIHFRVCNLLFLFY